MLQSGLRSTYIRNFICSAAPALSLQIVAPWKFYLSVGNRVSSNAISVVFTKGKHLEVFFVKLDSVRFLATAPRTSGC